MRARWPYWAGCGGMSRDFDRPGGIVAQHPWRSEGIELDRVDLPFRIVGTINRALDRRCAARGHCPARDRPRARPCARGEKPGQLVQSSSTAMRRPKCSASRGMSPLRAWSGGRVTTSNDSRSSRSARNRPSSTIRGKILVGCRDDPDVDRDRLGRADAGDLAIFDRAQQPVLRRRRQGRQLVEEQGAAVRLLEPAVPGLGGAGEAARLMAEQFGLDQIFGQRGAVHRHQRPRPARRQMMQPLGNQLLAGAALADYQHRPVERRGTARPLDRVEKGEALPDELIGPFHSPTCGGKSHHVARCFA